ncbi:hypothetical protein E2562_002989 [Oryza meyeriana var. granulata]|uniref:RRM domain-containing protein n=1 Tax=Oryza meyeriana var. granulata TaxID=110450 RepID=A0A6G1DDH5_9ORYZ|nr:hypothetical protein E2562_002989 [Oryza meyeriana var. granulata]
MLISFVVVFPPQLDVKLPQPKPSGGGPKPRSSDPKKKIFIGGLPPAVDEKQLKEYFEKFGEVTRPIVITQPQTKISRGFGFIEYASEVSATRALEKDRYYLCSQWVEVRRAMPKQDAAAAGPSRLSVQARPFYPARSSALAAANSTNNAPVIAPAKYFVGDNVNPSIGYEIPGVVLSQDVVHAIVANYLRGGGAPPPQGSVR